MINFCNIHVVFHNHHNVVWNLFHAYDPHALYGILARFVFTDWMCLWKIDLQAFVSMWGLKQEENGILLFDGSVLNRPFVLWTELIAPYVGNFVSKFSIASYIMC